MRPPPPPPQPLLPPPLLSPLPLRPGQPSLAWGQPLQCWIPHEGSRRLLRVVSLISPGGCGLGTRPLLCPPVPRLRYLHNMEQDHLQLVLRLRLTRRPCVAAVLERRPLLYRCRRWGVAVQFRLLLRAVGVAIWCLLPPPSPRPLPPPSPLLCSRDYEGAVGRAQRQVRCRPLPRLLPRPGRLQQ